jgi:GNAT superfamily N-acetyltransferase
MEGDRDVLVAYVDGEPAGHTALRVFSHGIGEVKRMYVVPARRGAGGGGRLYERAGYREIANYSSHPRANRWFERSLRELT